MSRVDENAGNNCKLVQGDQCWLLIKETLDLNLLWTPSVNMKKRNVHKNICIGRFLKAGVALEQSTSHQNQGPGGKILKVRNIQRRVFFIISLFHNFVVSLYRYFIFLLFQFFVISFFQMTEGEIVENGMFYFARRQLLEEGLFQVGNKRKHYGKF